MVGNLRSYFASSWQMPILGLALIACLFGPRIANAQLRETREYPPQGYYLAQQLLYDGDFASALKTFESVGRSGIRSTEGRWVDSICYFTMMGECLYHGGKLRPALAYYEEALKLFVIHQQWMLRVDFQPGIDPALAARRPANWGVSTRAATPGRFPDRYPILQGGIGVENLSAMRQTVVLALPEYMLINAHEVVRCTALAIRRRHELLGVACQHEVLTGQVLQALNARPARQNHWSQAWIDVQLGMAAAAAGKVQQAINNLSNGTSAGGSFDHPLTAMALFARGRLAFEEEQYASAAKLFFEASISAALYEQYDLVEESLRWGAKTHLVTFQPGPYPPLSMAAGWAARDWRFVEVSAIVAAAENAAVLNQTAAALNLTSQARRRMARTEMPLSAVGARLAYANAIANYQVGNMKVGDNSFSSLMSYQLQGGSQRLLEIERVGLAFESGIISERVAGLLYEQVLREPTGRDWVTSPVETQTVLMSNLQPSLENWLAAALKRREVEKALEIVDRIRRHRFHSTLPMGGRLISLRWVLDGPQSALSERAVLQRQSLLEMFPRYAALMDREAGARTELSALPLLPEDEVERQDRARWTNELVTISSEQEVLLREIALRRAPAQMAFPPQLDFKMAQERLQEGQAVLSFLRLRDRILAFSFGKDSYADPWALPPADLAKGIATMLRGMGHLDRTQPVDAELLQDSSWQEPAAELAKQLLSGVPLEDGIQELIIVPDERLWYLPFEALQVEADSGLKPLISRLRIRYAPTVALAFPDGRRPRPLAQTLVVAGKLFPQDDPSVALEAAKQLHEVLPRVTAMTAPTEIGSALLAPFCDRMIVLSDFDQKVAGPYDLSPLQIDRSKPASRLVNWMALPWGGPRQLILPGFHTAAEVGLKSGGSGQEVFLTLCGLMSTGSRTILLSRWRPGGQSSLDLIREFAQELPYVPASDAWQRSVELVRDSELILEREPRVKPTESEPSLMGDHPFFWAGYLLVDSGTAPAADDVVAEAAP